MSEFLTINTEDNVIRERRVDPLPLYDDNHFMLKQVMPEFSGPLPNQLMDNLVERLKVTMKLYGGLGLAANQCGVSERVFVIGTDQFQIACINPKIVGTSDVQAKENEGCLTFPGLYCKIERPNWVEVEFTTPDGELKQMKLDGATARCFQHELDHLNGIKFVDKIGPVALQMAKKKQQKIIKKITRLKK